MRNIVWRQLVSLQQPMHDLIDRRHDGTLQLLQPLVGLAENDPGDDVIPIADLTVVISGVVENFAFRQIDQLDPDGRGANVHRQSKWLWVRPPVRR